MSKKKLVAAAIAYALYVIFFRSITDIPNPRFGIAPFIIQSKIILFAIMILPAALAIRLKGSISLVLLAIFNTALWLTLVEKQLNHDEGFSGIHFAIYIGSFIASVYWRRERHMVSTSSENDLPQGHDQDRINRLKLQRKLFPSVAILISQTFAGISLGRGGGDDVRFALTIGVLLFLLKIYGDYHGVDYEN